MKMFVDKIHLSQEFKRVNVSENAVSGPNITQYKCTVFLSRTSVFC